MHSSCLLGSEHGAGVQVLLLVIWRFTVAVLFAERPVPEQLCQILVSKTFMYIMFCQPNAGNGSLVHRLRVPTDVEA